MVPTQVQELNAPPPTPTSAPFALHLSNFEGPFDLLLHLITRKKLDITDIALAEVTDEFLSYISGVFDADTDRGLDTASEFLVTAATLLDLKAARLLPRGAAHITANTDLLEARDLLFARLLQYRAYREVTAVLEERYVAEAQRFPRTVALDPRFSKVLPELVFDLSSEEFARIAAAALNPARDNEDPSKQDSEVETDHLHTPLTTIAAEEAHVLAQLGERGEITFAEIITGASAVEVAIVRFLAVLELFKEGALLLEQPQTLGPIIVSAPSTVEPEEREDA